MSFCLQVRDPEHTMPAFALHGRGCREVGSR